MKLEKTKLLCVAFVIMTIASCSDDYLDVEPKGLFLEENYYRNEAEAYSGLIAVYDILSKQSGGFENTITMMNAGSDDHFAGGGSPTDGAGIQAFSNYTLNGSTIPGSFWDNYFQGIFRANVLLNKLPNIPMPDDKKVRFTAECKALRAYYNFELVRLFKNIPLLIQPVTPDDIKNVIQSPPEAVYAQIEKDLQEAFIDLPMVLNAAEGNDERGRLNKGAVQALLGKVYLYEGKNDLAAAQLSEVNGIPGGTSQYGYRLLTNFSDLWIVSNKYNTESVFEIAHTSKGNTGWGNWGSGSDEGNTVNIMVAPRGFSRSNNTVPNYAAGWSFNPITNELYELIRFDPRFSATVADLKTLKAQGQVNYAPGFQDTGYFLKKFMPLISDITTGGGQAELNYKQNSYAMRLADTYLLEAEALGGTGERAQSLLNAVRARVGLAPTPVSLAAILAERRLELVGEGHRWFDLVRSGTAATVLSSRGFVAGKNEIFPIPFKETENTKIVQNPIYN